MMKAPSPFIVPPVTALPFTLPSGIGSPVSIDSSTKLLPSITTPSTGTREAGLMRSRSPTSTRESGTSWSTPSTTRHTVWGTSPMSASKAAPVALRARASSTWPSSTSTVMTAADSKYTPVPPPCLKACGT